MSQDDTRKRDRDEGGVSETLLVEPATKRPCTEPAAVSVVETKSPPKPDLLREAMPRTACINDDVMVIVHQRGVEWVPQAVTMKNLRQTKSALLDELIELDTHHLEIPPGTCQSQEDFVKLFTVDLYVGSTFCNQTSHFEAWDKLGFHAKVMNHLEGLEKQHSWIQRPDAVTLYRWGRRFHRPLLVSQACEIMLEPDYKGPAPEPDMFQQFLRTMRGFQQKRNLIRSKIEAFRKSVRSMECNEDECARSCNGDSDAHPKHNWDETEESDYEDCAVACLNDIAPLVGLDD